MFLNSFRLNSCWLSRQLWHALLLSVFALLAVFGTLQVQSQDFLDPEVAFKASARMRDASTLELTLTIADGYYLYRERFKFEAEGATLGVASMPLGKVKYDENFEKDVETYSHGLVISIPVQARSNFVLKLTQQGCAEAGLCYPPMTLRLPVSFVGQVQSADSGSMSQAPATLESGKVASSGIAGASESNLPPSANSRSTDAVTPLDDSGRLAQVLKEGRLLFIAPLFFLLGLGLSLTPCVLPMVPILSFIVVGEGAGLEKRRGFVLSLSYVLGMALVYTGLGVAAGLLGEGLSAALQHPWVLSAFAIVMVLFALSMFDVYQLQLPAALQTRLMAFSEAKRQHSGGKLLAVFMMGAISALIVGPCVAAPLAGALVYISQTKDVLIGATALFSMAMGMGVPLLVVGLSAGSLLPRAGAWMEEIKHFFGVLMLAMAIWMISPLLSAKSQMLAWAILFLAWGGYLWTVKRRLRIAKGMGTVAIVLGGLQAVGLATGAHDPWSPLAALRAPVATVHFERIRTSAELDAVLAQSSGKLVMFDFYADWCIACKEMEKFTFVDPQVKAKLDQMRLIQVDVTANNEDDKALLKRFGLFGPPGIIFFDRQGQELAGTRVIGYQKPEQFLKSLAHLPSD